MKKKSLLSLKKNQRGVSMVEYTLLLSMIAIVVIVNLGSTGNTAKGKIKHVSNTIQAATGVVDGEALGDGGDGGMPE